MKKWVNITCKIVAGFFLLLGVCVLALQSPKVQKRVIDMAIEGLQGAFDANVSFSSISIAGVNTLVIKDLLIIDPNPYTEDRFKRGWAPVDTLLYAKNVSASFTASGLLGKEGLTTLNRVRVDDAQFNLVIEPDSLYPVNISRMLRILSKGPEFIGIADLFDIRRLEGNNIRYRMFNFMEKKFKYTGVGINWDDMDVTASLKARNFRYGNGSIYAKVESGDLSEKSGYKGHVSGYFSMTTGNAYIGDIHLTDRWSDVRLDYYSMTFGNRLAFVDYVDSVAMHASVRPSRLSFQTLKYFTGYLPDCNVVLNVRKGTMDGPVNRLGVKDLTLSGAAAGAPEGADLCISGVVSHLADKEKQKELDVTLSESSFTTAGLSSLISGFLPDSSAVDLSAFAKDQTIRLNCNVRGQLDSLHAAASIETSGAGSLALDASLCNLGSDKPLGIMGDISTSRLDIRKIAGIEQLGELSAALSAKAAIPLDDIKKLSVDIDRLSVSKLEALGYAYSNIMVKGLIQNSSFNGSVSSRDPNLMLDFNGLVGLAENTGDLIYQFKLNLPNANLTALKLDKRPGESSVSGKIDANVRQTSAGNLHGEIGIDNLVLTGNGKEYNIGKIDILSHSGAGKYRVLFNSSFAQANYIGDCSILDAPGIFAAASLKNNLPSLLENNRHVFNGESFNLSIKLDDTDKILDFIMPGSYIADGSQIQANLRTNGEATIRLHSDRIAQKGSYLKDIDGLFKYFRGPAELSLKSSSLKYSNIGLEALSINGIAQKDSITLMSSYKDSNSETDKGSINLSALFSHKNGSLVTEIRPFNSAVVMSGDVWSISDSKILVKDKEVKISDFSIASEYGHLTLDGGVSSSRKDTLRADFNRFGLNILNTFLGGMNLQGELYGEAWLSSPVKDVPDLRAKLVCLNSSIADIALGELMIQAIPDNEALNLDLSFKNDGHRNIYGNASYHYSSQELTASLTLDKFNPMVAAPFLKGMVSELEGSISGTIKAEGTLDEIDLQSDGIVIEDTRVVLPMTGVPYSINGKISLDDEGVLVDNIDIKDNGNGSIHVQGRLDGIDIDIDRMALLNKADDGSGFYGTIFGSGTAHVSLDESVLTADADLYVPRDSKLHISPSSAAGADGSSILEFRAPEKTEDDFYLEASTKPRQGKLAFNAKARVTATPNLEILLELDKESGNVITAKGDGIITADVKPGGFSIGGDYNISEGKYHFSAMNIATKDFIIQQGSSIKFGGDIMDSEFDVTATHSLKTSLSALISDTTSVSTRRLVECGIHITDKLRSPNLDFTISVPDLDPTTKSLVESALNTEDKVQKQFIGLVVTSSFLPSEQSGIINNTGSNMIYSNLSAIMSGQLNNILQKLDIPLDFGLSYQQNEAGTDIYDVSVSTQLFDNRVVVNGSMGNRQYSTRGDDSVVGDVDVEIKLDDAGKVRLNLFSHSADDYTSYLDNTQRNGIGITYQQEYNKFSDFLRRIFMSRQEKEEMDSNKSLQPEERTRIVIE